jgi:enamine deaminase RidA (YjgF/YER057c/UK114 family)
MRAERAERDRGGERKRGDEQAGSGVHPGYRRDGGGRLRPSHSHLRRQPLFVYNEASFHSAGKDSTMTLQRYHVGKRLADMVVHNGTIYLAGQVANDLSADVTTQTRQVLATIDRLLGEVGSDKTKILSVTIYLPDMNDFGAMNAVWEAWVPAGQTPARATVQARLAASGYKIEIQVIAAV